MTERLQPFESILPVPRPVTSLGLLLPTSDNDDDPTVLLARIRKKQTSRHILAERERFINALSDKSPQNNPANTYMRSPAAQRMAVQARFRDLYFSKDGMKYLGFEMALKLAPTRSFVLAVDAQCLVITGAASGDQRMLDYAAKVYGMALQSLREDIAGPNPILIRLMATVHTLETCEMFAAISDDGTGWQKHAQAVSYLTNLLRAEQRAAQAPQVGRMVNAEVRVPFSLWNALLSRQPVQATRQLYSPEFGGKFNQGNIVAGFGETTLQVSGILAYCDRIRLQGTRAELKDVTKALNRLTAMEGALHAYLVNYYRTLDSSPYRTERIGSPPELPRSERMDRDEVFPQAYWFQDMGGLIFHVSYWMCLLCCRQTHLDIRRNVPARAYPFSYTEKKLETQTKEANECADDLCMSVAYACLPKNGYMGLISAIPTVQLAAKWYKRQNDNTKLEWCQRAMERLEVFGLRAPNIGFDVPQFGDPSSKILPIGTRPAPSATAKPPVQANTKAKRTQEPQHLT